MKSAKTAQGAEQETNPQQKFGLLITTSLIVGTMIGSGVFLLPASLAPYGIMGLWGWLFAATGAITLAWVFAKLSHWQPGQGGPYYYTRIGIGEFPAFIVAWGYWNSIWTGNAAVALAAVSYAKGFIPALEQSKTLATLTGLLFVWVFAAINIRGVREAGITQLITTLCKAIPLILFGVTGLFFMDLSHFEQPVLVTTPEPPSFAVMTIAAAALWLWAFLGVESASIPSDNIAEPEKNIPKATMLGVFSVAVIYLLGFIVVYGVIPPERLANSSGPFAEAAGIIWGSWGGHLMTLVALISTLGALNGLILMGGQMPLAAARDKLFPSWFGKQNKHQSPGLGIFISSLLTSALILFSSSEALLQVFNFAILLSTTSILVPYLFCSAAAFRFQMTRKEKFQKLSLLIICGAFLFSMWALAGAGQQAVYWGFILMMAGIPVYTWLKIRQDKSA
jgi:APA family basic amino acid/polyamine antiporter